MLAYQIINGIVLGGIYALMALGFTMVFGIAKIGNFAHGEWMMLGAYVTLMASTILHLNFFAALIVSMIIMFGFGVLMERTVFRAVRGRPVINTLLISIGLMYFLRNLAEAIWGNYPRRMPVSIEGVLTFGEFSISYQRLIALAITATLILLLWFVLHYTRIGKAVRAYSQDSYAASIVGIGTKQVNMFIFGAGALLAAASGSIIGMLFSINPEMGYMPLLKSFAIVIFGGMGSLVGAVLGGVILGLIEVMGASYISSLYQDVFAFSIMIIILLFKPTGLFGEVER